MLLLSLKKFKINFYGQVKKVKLNTQHCKNGGLKNVDIELKIISLKCSWIRRLYNEVDHDWKIIPLNYIYNTLGKNFTFHSNLSILNKTLIPLKLNLGVLLFFVLQMFLLLFLHSAYGTIHT